MNKYTQLHIITEAIKEHQLFLYRLISICRRWILAKSDDISSTERLLNLIRKKSGDRKSASYPQALYGKEKKTLSQFFPFGKTITIGVDIHYDDLKLVKIQHTADKNLEMLDYVTVPFGSEISPSSTRFAPFLQQTISDFCGTAARPEIWSIFSSARVEAHYLRIPRVKKTDVASAVFWAYRKKTPFEKKEKIFDFDIIGEIVEQGIPKIEVLAYTAPEPEITGLKNLFTQAGYPLKGISIAPFALQNLFKTKWIKTAEQNVSSLYIGRGWSRIDIFSGGTLVLSRGIKAGMKSMVESIREEIEETQFDSTLEILSSSEETDTSSLFEGSISMSAEDASEIFSAFLDNNFPLPEHLARYQCGKEKIFEMILPAWERLIRQVERTLEYFSQNFEGATVERIFVSGRISSHTGLVNHIGEQLTLPTEAIDPFPRGASISPVIRRPKTVSERDALAPAVGMALSSNEITPNFIYTNKDREQNVRFQIVNKIIIATSAVLILACFGFYLWQSSIIAEKTARNQSVLREVEKNAPFADKSVIVQMVARTIRNGKVLSVYTEKYRSLAAIGGISRNTPPEIKLISITVQNDALPQKGKAAQTPALFLKGVIFGDHLKREAALASYLEKLKGSPLLDKPEVTEKLLKNSAQGELLFFSIRFSLL